MPYMALFPFYVYIIISIVNFIGFYALLKPCKCFNDKIYLYGILKALYGFIWLYNGVLFYAVHPAKHTHGSS